MLKLHGFDHLLEDSEHGNGTEFRQVLLTSVLVTDMSRHFPFVEKLTQMGGRLKLNGYKSNDVKEDRLVICSALMKCGDISNPVSWISVSAIFSSSTLHSCHFIYFYRADLIMSLPFGLPHSSKNGQSKLKLKLNSNYPYQS